MSEAERIRDEYRPVPPPRRSHAARDTGPSSGEAGRAPSWTGAAVLEALRVLNTHYRGLIREGAA